MDFQCPHCRQGLQGDDELVGHSIKCPSCAKKITVPEPEKIDEAQAARSQMLSSHTSIGKSDGSNVSIWISMAIGFGITVAVVLAVLPFRGSYLGDLILERGNVPFATIFLAGWSAAILILKQQLLRKQKAAMLLNLLPSAIGDEIDAENTLDFLAHIKGLPARVQDSFMVQRARLGLEHFFLRKSNPEVASMMMVQAEIDSGTVRSSYSLIKVFVWAIPILGFIGTVIGISGAVGGFDGALKGAADVEALKTSLGTVTGGLGEAFDTTLIALVLSLIISIPASAMQKAEEDLLGQVDAWCNNGLLKRLNDAGGVSDVALHTQTLSTALSKAFTGDQREVVEEMREMVKQMKAVQDSMNHSAGSWGEEMEGAAAALVKQGDQAWSQVSTELTASFAHMREALSNLNDVLGQLDGKQVQIETRKRGLFGR